MIAKTEGYTSEEWFGCALKKSIVDGVVVFENGGDRLESYASATMTWGEIDSISDDKWDDVTGDSEIYAIRDSVDQIVYIGVGAHIRSRLLQHIGLGLGLSTPVGKYITGNMPNSALWNVSVYQAPKRIEVYLIRRYNPWFNTVGRDLAASVAPIPSPLALPDADLDLQQAPSDFVQLDISGDD